MHPCSVDECHIGGKCVAAGTPKINDPCLACLPIVALSSWSDDDDNVSCQQTPYWQGLARDVATTPYGHDVPISCHNCYTNSSSSLADTLAQIHAAIDAGADLIELDLKEQDTIVYVDHDDDGGTDGATLAQVLADAKLKAADQPLFIELKETEPNETFVKDVLDALSANNAAFAKKGRPAVLRAFSAVSHNLIIARRLLATKAYATLRPHLRLHELMSTGDGNNVASLQDKVRAVKYSGFHGVEFGYRSQNLMAGLAYARSLGLGTSAYTIPDKFGEAYLSALRDEFDSLTTDYPLDKARAVVETDNALLYLNVEQQKSGAKDITYFNLTKQSTTHAINGNDLPSGNQATVGQALFGTTLDFDPSYKQRLTLDDADNVSGDGYLVLVSLTFDDLLPPDGQTAVIMGKADASSFSLELRNPAGGGDGDTVLRFAVHVDGSYRYATYPASQLNTKESYLVMGCYDGDGAVRIWVNNNDSGSTTDGPYDKGVSRNDSPVLIGADPEGNGAPRYFFDGQIQRALLQNWSDH